MPKIITGKPKITDAETDKVVSHFFSGELPKVIIVGIRGYYPTTYGKAGNDFNEWDDAFLVYENGTLLATFNGNTDPTKMRVDDAMLDEGVYHFYKGVHNGRVKGLRAYPEGVKLPCKRQNSKGVWYKSLCSLINFHNPVGWTTGSEGCQTLPEPQYKQFRDLLYDLRDKHGLKVVTYLLIDEETMTEIIKAR